MADAIDEVRKRWPQWRIERIGNVTTGWVYTARPRAEEIQPPVWEHRQLVLGLKTSVSHPDLRELERLIGVQAGLRRQMIEADMRPFNGRTYVEIEIAEARDA